MSQHFQGETYDELPLPSGALASGGVEMLRAGVVERELFITARRAFDDPAGWGAVLAGVAQRLAALYAAETEWGEADVAERIGAGFQVALAAAKDPSGKRTKRKRAATSRALRTAPAARKRTHPQSARGRG
jgi:hypothetical protein